jgi:type IV secretory pathway TraG/TraD family ATPase VirD4
MATRLRTMIASDGGAALTHGPEDPHIDLLTSITRGDLVVFTLPQGAYPELVPHVARYVLQALASVCTRIEQRGTTANALVFVDELSAFDGDQLCAGFERGRSAGVRFVVATQSLSNLATAGGDKLLHAALDNAELLVIHRQAVPEAVELLASIAGTEEAWEHTHQVSDQIGRPIGWDETGVRARRLTDRFRAHPNVIKQLAQGEAVLVTHRPRLEVRQVRVRAFLTAGPNVQKQLR